MTVGNFRAYAGMAEVEASRGAITRRLPTIRKPPRAGRRRVARESRPAVRAAESRREAAASFERALQLRPDDAKHAQQSGHDAGEAGRWPEAIAHYRRSIALTPAYALAHRNLGLALRDHRRRHRGLARVSRHCAGSGEAQWHYEVAMMLLALNRTAEAIDQLQQTIRLQPQHQAARELLSKLGR